MMRSLYSIGEKRFVFPDLAMKGTIDYESKNWLLLEAKRYTIKNSFDFVFCFGVLQHTPNPQKSFAAFGCFECQTSLKTVRQEIPP